MARRSMRHWISCRRHRLCVIMILLFEGRAVAVDVKRINLRSRMDLSQIVKNRNCRRWRAFLSCLPGTFNAPLPDMSIAPQTVKNYSAVEVFSGSRERHRHWIGSVRWRRSFRRSLLVGTSTTGPAASDDEGAD